MHDNDFAIQLNKYLQLTYSELCRIDLEPPLPDLGIAIVIPAFAEDDIPAVLESLRQCHFVGCSVEVFIIINEGVSVEQDHQSINHQSYKDCQEWVNNHRIEFEIKALYVQEIPDKIAGVGTARKIGMDIVTERLKVGLGLEKGVIVNLDADCRVSQNYLTEIWKHFKSNSKDELVSIAFEHRIEELGTEPEKESIRQYEAYLHYFIGKQKELGLPYAYQTIGSAFAVRGRAYLQVGGMNRRKAGEDFYFIHKFTKKGTIAELNTCTVYPSGRASFRVPFGTGRAVGEMLASEQIYYAYNPKSFDELRPFITSVVTIFENGIDSHILNTYSKGVQRYLESQNFSTQISKIRSNSKSIITFRKAFFQWFDAFRLMKYLHFMRDGYYEDVCVDNVT